MFNDSKAFHCKRFQSYIFHSNSSVIKTLLNIFMYSFNKFIFFIILTAIAPIQFIAIWTSFTTFTTVRIYNGDMYFCFWSWRECSGNSFLQWVSTILFPAIISWVWQQGRRKIRWFALKSSVMCSKNFWSKCFSGWWINFLWIQLLFGKHVPF